MNFAIIVEINGEFLVAETQISDLDIAYQFYKYARRAFISYSSAIAAVTSTYENLFSPVSPELCIMEKSISQQPLRIILNRYDCAVVRRLGEEWVFHH